MWLLLVLAAGAVTPAVAQTPEPTTRAEVLRQEREKKQQALRPNRPDGLQRAMDYAEDRAMFLLSREGFYPKIGTLTTGSGFAFGLGYRDRDLYAHRGVVEVWAAGTPKKYWATQARLAFPDLLDGRLLVETTANLREYPEEWFFGLGPNSPRRNETKYWFRMSEVGGNGSVRVAPVVSVGAGASWFAPETAAGELDYLRSTGFVEVDYREPKYGRRGGWYRLNFSHYSDRNAGALSFNRTDIDVRQFFGFLADRRVIAVRGWVSTTVAADDSIGIPFYLMPTLGGNDTLRGFRNYRFRAPHAILFQAEYRWEIWSGLDAAIFYDAGKVAMRRGDLNFKDLEKDYGFGFRFNTSESVILRVDAAFGSPDGKHLHVVFGGVF